MHLSTTSEQVAQLSQRDRATP